MIKIKEGFKGERSVVVPPFIKERLVTDPFLSTLYITDIGYYPSAEHHYVKRSEPVAQHVLLYCINGCGHFSIGKNGESVEIHENQYVILPAGVPHEYSSCTQSPWTIYWIHFGGTLASYYANGADVPKDVRPNTESRISNRISLFEEILSVMRMELSDDNLHYASSMLHHFLASLRFLHTYRGVNMQNKDTNIISAAQHYMAENLERRLTLKQVADYVGLSVSNFSMKFHRETGCSPIAYINRLRIEQACYMLKATDMHVNQICYKVGINDALYFSRIFSKHTGVSPTEYRQKNS